MTLDKTTIIVITYKTLFLTKEITSTELHEKKML